MNKLSQRATKRLEDRALTKFINLYNEMYDELGSLLFYVDWDANPNSKCPYNMWNQIYIAEFDKKFAKNRKTPKLEEMYRGFHKEVIDNGVTISDFWYKVYSWTANLAN
jgi:hypothetical protein